MTGTLNENQHKIIEDFFLFRDVDASCVKKCLSEAHCRLCNFKKGEEIFTPSSYSAGIALILSGCVEVSKQPQPGQRLIMSVLNPGSAFGAATLYTDSSVYFTTLTATTDSRVLFIPASAVDTLLREDFRAAENYLRYLSRRIEFLNGKIDALAAMSGSGKLLNWLRTHASSDGIITLEVSMTALSSALSMGRASLYRAFDELEQNGVIHRDGKTVTIL